MTLIPTDPDAQVPAVPVARSRRSLLRAAGLAASIGAAGGIAAACATDEPAATPSSAASSSTSPVPADSSSSAGSTSSPTPTATEPETTAPAPSGPSVEVAAVPVGGGVILADADYVVTQPKKGDFKAFSKICTHMGCPVTDVAEAKIHCNCHQSFFSISDGSVISGQARRSLAEHATTVAGGKVYVTT